MEIGGRMMAADVLEMDKSVDIMLRCPGSVAAPRMKRAVLVL
jgi:hypothetical protein